MGAVNKPLEERFWAKVDRSGQDDCWFWKAAVDPISGYGRFGLPGNKIENAPRRALILSSGSGAPPGVVCRHLCSARYARGYVSYRLCCNPGHLAWGTDKDNADDCYADDRAAYGVRHSSAKNSDDRVLLIVAMLLAGRTQAAVAAIYGVARTNISAIATGRSWKRAV